MGLADWMSAAASFAVFVALLYLAALLARRAWLSAAGGLFDCALRSAEYRRWRLGLARYAGDQLEWYLVWHPWPRPAKVFKRDQVELAGLRACDDEESTLGYATARILELSVVGEKSERWQLALNEGSAVGLVSWLESAPPGQVGYRRILDN